MSTMTNRRRICPVCRRRPLPNPNRSRKSRCHCCDKRRERKNNPMRAAFNRLKDSARDREILFTLTFEEFMEFALQCDYLEEKGPFAHSLTVDRINNLRGYEPDNIQPMSRSENTRKQMRHDEERMRAGFAWQR